MCTLRRALWIKMTPRKEIKCGTYSGYQRHYRQKETACAECKAAAVQYVIEYQKRNPEKMRLRRRKYQRTSLARKAARARQKVRRRARLKGNRVEYYTLKEVLEKYGTICYLCNLEIDMSAPRHCGIEGWENGLHLDHVIDIQYGGADALDNVRPTHALCNVSKRSRNDEKAPTQDFS